MKPVPFALCLSGLLAAFSQSALASPITLNFANYTGPTESLATYQANSGGTPYSDFGYTFVSGTQTAGAEVDLNANQGDVKPGLSTHEPVVGSPGTAGTSNVIMAISSGADFQLNSFDLGSLLGTTSFTVTGILNGVTQYSYTGTDTATTAPCTPPANAGSGSPAICYTLFTLPPADSAMVSSVDFAFTGTSSAGVVTYLDNITATTPEPNSLLLLGTGLLSGCAVAYRKRRNLFA